MPHEVEYCGRVAKYKYLYPLDRAVRRQIAPLAKPYPKREPCGKASKVTRSGLQPEKAGSIPAVRFKEVDGPRVFTNA